MISVLHPVRGCLICTSKGPLTAKRMNRRSRWAYRCFGRVPIHSFLWLMKRGLSEKCWERIRFGTHQKTQFCRRFWSQQKPSGTSIPANLPRFYRPECTSKKQRNRNSNFHYPSKTNPKKSLRRSPPIRSPPFVGRSSFSTATNLGLYAVGWKRMNAVLLLMELEIRQKALLITHSAVPTPTDLRA